MKVLSVANQKGGVGKTTTSVNLAAALASKFQRTLLIDIDPQANATSGLGIDKNSINKTVYQVLLGQATIQEAVRDTYIQSLQIVPSSIALVGAEIELVSTEDKERRLMYAITEIISKNRYDFVIIDSPPSLGLLTLNSLTAAHGVIIPMQCEYYALEGLAQLLETINLVKRNLNVPLDIFGVLLSMVDLRSNLTGQVIQEVRNYFAEKVFTTIVPRSIRLAEAPGFGKSILHYDVASKGARAYMDLAMEVIARSQGRPFVPAPEGEVAAPAQAEEPAPVA